MSYLILSSGQQVLACVCCVIGRWGEKKRGGGRGRVNVVRPRCLLQKNKDLRGKWESNITHVWCVKLSDY